MQLHIVPGDELPIYRQIMRQITDAIGGGRLRRGDKLPSQRDLAVELVISPLTVKKAYDELEREGVIETRRGRGTFVNSVTPAVDPALQRQRLYRSNSRAGQIDAKPVRSGCGCLSAMSSVPRCALRGLRRGSRLRLKESRVGQNWAMRKSTGSFAC